MSENNTRPELSRRIDSKAFALAEYASLRDEMLKQIDFQHQLIALALVVTGTFLSLGTQPSTEPVLLLAYPILSMFLVLGWVSSNIRIQRITLYIKEQIENRVEGAGWEQYYFSKTANTKRSMSILYARGVFIGTQVVVVLLALPRLSLTTLEIGLLTADVLAVVIGLYLIRSNRPPWL